MNKFGILALALNSSFSLELQWLTHGTNIISGTLKIPSIPKLQQLIEAAWSQGFDPQGKEQLQKLVHTRKWIGATEICAVLSSLKVK